MSGGDVLFDVGDDAHHASDQWVEMAHDRIGSIVVDEYVVKTYTWWHSSYVMDWAIMVLFMTFELVVTFQATPRVRFVPTYEPSGNLAQNLMYTYPHHRSVVPLSALILLSFALPLSLLVAYHVIRRHVWKRCGTTRMWHDIHSTTLGLCQALALTVVITTSIKYGIGRPRPNMYANPEKTSSFLSFPSGHSSISFAGYTFLTLFVTARLRTFHPYRGEFWRFLVSFSPIAMASWIALTRVIDYHHDFVDIVVGGFIGIVSAYCCYHLHYPSAFTSVSVTPKWRFYGDHRAPLLSSRGRQESSV